MRDRPMLYENYGDFFDTPLDFFFLPAFRCSVRSSNGFSGGQIEKHPGDFRKERWRSLFWKDCWNSTRWAPTIVISGVIRSINKWPYTKVTGILILLKRGNLALFITGSGANFVRRLHDILSFDVVLMYWCTCHVHGGFFLEVNHMMFTVMYITII